MERFAKKKEKNCLKRQIIALFSLNLPKGPINLALSRIDIYLKQLAPCCPAGCVGCMGEIGQQGVGQPPNPLRSRGSGPDMASSSLQGRTRQEVLTMCVLKPASSKETHWASDRKCHNPGLGGGGLAVELTWRPYCPEVSRCVPGA